MIVADYTYYAETFGGGLSEAEFNRLAPKAAATIDALTFGRCVNLPDPVADNVRSAMCAVVDEIDATAGGVVASASNDGYTETYAVTRTADQRLRDVASLYLAATGLMFCGGLRRC